MLSRFTKGLFGHPRHERGHIGAAGDAGFGATYKQAWEFRPLPGAGALQYAWQTLALPLYTPIGAGVRNQRQFRGTQSAPVMVAVQGTTLAPIQGTPIIGEQTGQFTQAPLLDIQQAEDYGFVSQSNSYAMPSGNSFA